MKAAFTVAVFLVLGVSASCGATTPKSATSQSAATVRFSGLRPIVTVRGAHFAPFENVRVTVRVGAAKRARNAHTSAAGTFTVDLGTISKADRCSGAVAVFASGETGDRASYRLPPMGCPTSTADGQSR
jgi:hypothetical protein